MRRSLAHDMARFDFLATRSQLHALGYSAADIRRLVGERALWAIRRAWLAHPGADPQAMRAVGLGARLAAGSALASYGVWVTRPSGLWVGNVQGSSRLPNTASGEHRLWVREHFPRRTDRQWRMSLPDALVQFSRLESEADLIASIDSAMHQRLLSRRELDLVIGVLPRRLRRIGGLVNPLADSGQETLMRLGAEGEGWQVEVQVKIDGVGRVDLLINGWLVVELDSRQWHDNEPSQDEDHRRNAELTLRGYRWHRFRPAQVLDDMPMCLEVIRTILAEGRP
jgi:very-short-patch-repair endonuclease